MSRCVLHTKSKKADSNSVLSDSRNTSARALTTEEFERFLLKIKNCFNFYCQFPEITLSLKGYFGRIRNDQEGFKTPKSERKNEPTFVGIPEFREFLLCPGAYQH